MLEIIQANRWFTGITILTLVFLVASAAVILNNRTVDRLSRRVFLDSLLALFVISAIDWFTYVTSGQFPELRGAHATLMALTFSVAPAIPVAIADSVFPANNVKWIRALLVAHAVFQVGSIFFGYVFWIDENNVYHRGQLYFVYMVVYNVAALYLVIESVRMGKAYQSSIVAIVAVLLCLLIGAGIQVLDSSVRTTWPAVSMTVLLFFTYYSDMVLRAEPLTKLLNRRSYEEFLAKPKLPCVIVVIDVDNFKHVNDTYGHAFGDECLVRVAAGIRRTFGAMGLCYRTGGDEFAVIMTKRLEEADALCESLKGTVERMRLEDDRMPSVSAGCSLARAGSDLAEIINEADKAMYESKRSGKRE